MILRQLYLGCLSQASYLVGDDESGQVAVVDPRRDVDVYLEAAREGGMTITHVLLTHLHADFLAGHLELQEQTGAEICLGAGVETEYASRSLADGEVLTLGAVSLSIMATPGHTPESISVVVYDGDPANARPHAVLTGDALFIGDVGRPDLMASVGFTAEELASRLYDSLHQKLMKLPDDTLVYPAHGAGSLCGKSLGTETVSTIGEQRKLNYALKPMPREEFVSMLCREQPAAPRYFPYDARLNKQKHEILEHALERSLVPLSLDDVLRRMNAGARVLDVRREDAWARRHLDGSVNVALDGRFASWAGTVIEPGTPIVLIAEDGREREAALRLGRIGFDTVVGFLEGGAAAFETRQELCSAIERMEPEMAAAHLQQRDPPLVIDVRTPGEHASMRIPGSLNLSLADLEREIDRIPRDRPLLLHCRTGYRSSVAAGLLESVGIRRISDLRGGILAWEEKGLPVERAE